MLAYICNSNKQIMETNYIQEVLKVYPDALCGWDYNVNQTYAIRYWIKSGDKLLSEKFSTSLSAWQNAYNHILNSKQ